MFCFLYIIDVCHVVMNCIPKDQTWDLHAVNIICVCVFRAFFLVCFLKRMCEKNDDWDKDVWWFCKNPFERFSCDFICSHLLCTPIPFQSNESYTLCVSLFKNNSDQRIISKQSKVSLIFFFSFITLSHQISPTHWNIRASEYVWSCGYVNSLCNSYII